jgi:hypothetical protein
MIIFYAAVYGLIRLGLRHLQLIRIDWNGS